MIPKQYTQAFLVAPRSVELKQLPMPEPGPGESLMRVDAATVCATDIKVYRRGSHPTMLTLPAPFGHEVTGTIVRSDADALFEEGDAVVVANSALCGHCQPCRHSRENLCRELVYLNGAFSNYFLIPAAVATRSVHRRPPGLEPAIASLAEPLACAVHCLEPCLAAWGGPPTEARALVIGCGALGLMLIDLLHSVRTRVTALDPHPERLELAAAFGAVETHCERAGDGGSQPSDCSISPSTRPAPQLAGTTRLSLARRAASPPSSEVAGKAPS